MPEHIPGESREKWMARCVPIVSKENGGDNKAAVGKCEGMYDSHQKKSKAAVEDWASQFLDPTYDAQAMKRAEMKDSDFAYIDENGGKHLPIMDAAHVRNALARFNQTSIPEDKKAAVHAKIVAAAHRFGIDVSSDKK